MTTQAATHRIKEGRFVCDGDDASICHIYPDCDCDLWLPEEDTGQHRHPDIVHKECWMVPWIEATNLRDTHQDYCNAPDVLHDGEVLTEWTGEGVLWEYAVEPEAIS